MRFMPKSALRTGSERLIVAGLLLFTAAPALAQPSEPRWQVGLVPSLLSGTYGVDSRTDIWYTPLIVRRLFDAGDVTVVVPHMCIRGDDDITVVGDIPVRTTAEDTTGRTPDGRTPPSSQRPAAADATASSATVSSSACGLGDVILRGRYYLVDQHGRWPTIAARAQVKLPTADDAAGLGTGRPDHGIGLEVTRSVGRGVLIMADGGYTKMGQPAGYQFRDRWWYDIGVSRTVVANRLDVSVFYEHYRSIVDGRPDARDLLGVLTLRGNGGWRIQMSGQVGLSDGAPDVGLTVGATSRF